MDIPAIDRRAPRELDTRSSASTFVGDAVALPPCAAVGWRSANRSAREFDFEDRARRAGRSGPGTSDRCLPHHVTIASASSLPARKRSPNLRLCGTSTSHRFGTDRGRQHCATGHRGDSSRRDGHSATPTGIESRTHRAQPRAAARQRVVHRRRAAWQPTIQRSRGARLPHYLNSVNPTCERQRGAPTAVYYLILAVPPPMSAPSSAVATSTLSADELVDRANNNAARPTHAPARQGSRAVLIARRRYRQLEARTPQTHRRRRRSASDPATGTCMRLEALPHHCDDGRGARALGTLHVLTDHSARLPISHGSTKRASAAARNRTVRPNGNRSVAAGPI